MKTPSIPTAAIVIIGNEVLSAQVQDLNFLYLAKTLTSLGVSVQKCEIIRDDEETIIDSIKYLKDKYTYIFTTGGIGPTHDDLTMAAISKLFKVPLIRHPKIEKAFYDRYPPVDEQHQAHLRMADLPLGARLLFSDLSIAPGICLENVYVLPGVPPIMQDMVRNLISSLQHGPHSYQKQIFCHAPESRITHPLENLQKHYTDIEIGSYPSWQSTMDKGTLLVFKGYNKKILDQCVEELLQYLQKHSISFYISIPKF